MAMTKKFAEALIAKGWRPYIKTHWMEWGGKRRAGGAVLTFEGHEQHEFKCTYKVANSLVKPNR